MNIEAFRAYCLAKPGTTEGFPFDQETLVFKVMGKIFALTDIDTFEFVNLKCDPDRAVQLREQYDGIIPGYHMNKKLWNSVYIHTMGDEIVLELTDHSYDLIVDSLPKKDREALTQIRE